MYEMHDSKDGTGHENLEHSFLPELPEPLDHWSLDDFEDLLPQRRTAW
jgi:hypothetical protein